jgi:FixJ family two-component response regulator
MILNFHGIERDHKDWAAFVGITEQTMRWRIKHWGVERALTTTRNVRVRKRTRNRSELLKLSDKDRAVKRYIAGDSEDDIAGDLGVSRRYLSQQLIAWGLKLRGRAPTRVASPATATIQTTSDNIRITIAA